MSPPVTEPAGGAATAPGRAYAYDDPRPAHSHAYLRSHIARAIDAGTWSVPARALDYGCGNGSLTGWLAGKGFAAVGVDISESGIEVARKAFPAAVFSTDVSAENLARLGPFDLVLCSEVIAHCYVPSAELKKIFDCLRPGGRLVLTTPYHGYLKNLVLAVTGRLEGHLDTLWSGSYVHFFTVASITRLLAQAGFADIAVVRAGRVRYLAKSMVVTCTKPIR